MTTSQTLTGGCLCGAVKYDIDGSPFDADYCHCNICRKNVGAFAVCWMDFRVEQISWISGKPKEFNSSETIRRGFCEQCGTSLSYRSTEYPGYCSLTIASLDNPNQVTPNYHIYTEDQVKWLKIEDNCQRYPKSRSGG